MKPRKRKVLIDTEKFFLVKVMSQCGLRAQSIAEDLHITKCQVSYRRGLYKQVMGLKHGLSTRWARGEEPLLWQLIHDQAGVQRLEWERKFLPRIIQPTPKTVSLAEQAERDLKRKDIQ